MTNSAYLTIDDAPSEEFRQKVDFLLSKNIPAIFFCRGTRLEERKEEVVYAIQKGFVIGNHTYSHPHFSKLSKEECFKQIAITDKLIEEVYRKAGRKRPAKLFRFSYGDKGAGDEFEKGWREECRKNVRKADRERVAEVQAFLKKHGYVQPKFQGITHSWYRKAKLEKDFDVVWTYDTHDWRLYRWLDKLEAIFKRMDESPDLNSKNSDNIVLMHDFPQTFELFKQIIERMIQKGLKFKSPEITYENNNFNASSSHRKHKKNPKSAYRKLSRRKLRH